MVFEAQKFRVQIPFLRGPTGCGRVALKPKTGERKNAEPTANPAQPEEPPRKRRRRSPPRQMPREYLTRYELLALVPLSMSSIDNLEKSGVFPSRFRIEPTTRVAWKRKEVERFMAQRAAKRMHGKGEGQPAT